MKSLPTTIDYQTQEENNNQLVETLFDKLFPDTSVPYDEIFKIISYLQETNVNPQVLPRVIRGINNLMLGTGEGEVVVHVRKDVVTLETKERDGEIKVKNI